MQPVQGSILLFLTSGSSPSSWRIASASGNLVMESEPTAPLIPADVEGGTQLADDICILASHDHFQSILPFPFNYIRSIMNITSLRRYVCLIYAISLIVPIVSLYYLYLEFVVDHENELAGALIFLFNIVETGVIVALPYISYNFLLEALYAEDVSELFRAATLLDTNLPKKFTALIIFNTILVFVSIVIFCVYMSKLQVVERVVFGIYGTMYLVPFCAMYTMMLFILACHRLMLQSYHRTICAHIGSVQQQRKSVSSGIIIALREEYMTLQYFTRTTATRRGSTMYMLFLFSTLFVTYVIWSIYWHEFAVLAMVSHVLSSLVALCELGWLLTSVNETGYVISRDLSALLLFSHQADESTKRDVSIFLQCSASSVLVIPFFRSVVLRTQTFIGLLGSAVGAIIPGILQY